MMFYGEIVVEDKKTGEKTVIQPSRVDYWAPPTYCVSDEDFSEYAPTMTTEKP